MNRKIYIISTILISILILSGTQAIAQKSLVDEKLKEYQITDDFFIDNLSEESANHAFKIKVTEETDTETTVKIASFDPRKAIVLLPPLF